MTSESGLSAGTGVVERGRVLLGSRRRDQHDIGKELPAYTTSLGKVLMAYLPRNQANAVNLIEA